ncbi:MAG: phosphohydrolase, partial [Pseudomonadales bacterium]|nr:phosphohydrolase [Pseudomonadales bacterium]
DKEKNSDIKIAYMVQNFLSGIVSGEVDADRADYMLRDGFHSSVSIGSYNLDHLLSNLRFGWDLETPWLGLAITRKGLGALEDFVYSRHQMYRQVYAHKTALGFDFILREAINEVLSDPFIFDHIDSCLSDMHNFCDLTDHFFWEAFRTHARSVQKSYSSCITQRIKLKHLKTEENIELNEVYAIRHDLAKQLKIDDDQIVTCTMKARFSNIRENFDKIKVLIKNPITGARDLQQISEVSSFFQKFSDGTIVHFYQKPF